MVFPSDKSSLLNKVMSHIGAQECNLMLRVPNETIYGHKKKVCLEKNVSIGPIVWNKVISCFISPYFIMFLYTSNDHKS